jgi:hypothetical protein
MKDGAQDGDVEIELGVWYGNDVNQTSGPYCTASAETMPNNGWYTITCNNVDEARGASGHYFYRLEATRPIEGYGINAFKLRSNAYLSFGNSDLVDSNIAFVGMVVSGLDLNVVFPNGFDGESTYNGAWDFYFYIEPAEYPTHTVTLEVWDGDFDRGTTDVVAADTDDPNTQGKPEWADNPFTQEEGFGGQGAPADNTWSTLFRRGDPVWYEITDPTGTPIYTNDEPSGTEEWERYVVTSDPELDPNNAASTVPAVDRADQYTDELMTGWYGWHIEGLDIHNTVWIRVNAEVVTQPPPPPCDATCPRTIGYWKNNVKKVLIQGRTRGVQETEDSIHTGLYLVSQYSPLFRSGLNVNDPEPIDAIVRLTDEEANAILQKENGNSMLDRALQQNLATWLNVMTGKICPDTIVTLDSPSGHFEGTVMDALLLAQDIILASSADSPHPDLEWAKDMADLINNAQINLDPEEVLACDAYTGIMPPEEQPPAWDDLPQAPEPEPVPNPTVEPQPDPETCEGVRVNTYNVEVTDNPFAGIKFEYQSGTEVKNGDFEEFRITLTAEQVANLTSVQMEAKAGQEVESGTVSLENCAWDQPIPCGEPIRGGSFAFYFMGAEDNGDGTFTLIFHIQNFTEFGLSHATIGLPDGQVDPGSYEARVCPTD